MSNDQTNQPPVGGNSCRGVGLLADENYAQISAEQIESVAFHIRDSGTTYSYVNLYALTGAWTESTVTYGNIPAWSTTVYDSESMGGGTWDVFDLTALAKEWKNGTQNGEYGFVMVSADSTKKTATYSSEHPTTDSRPYVEVTYANAITLPATAEVYKGDTITLTATTVPAGQAVTWTSSTPTIATVDNGVVTGVSAGTATITATLEDGASAQCVVTVLAKSITLNQTSANVYKGETVTLSATTVPAGETVEWISANESIATVANGVITGVEVGSTTITARVDADTYAICSVTVVAKNIVISADYYEVLVNGTASVSAETEPEGQSITWTSSDTDILRHLSGGAFAALKAGTVTVTATLADGTSDTCTVRVVLPDGIYRIKNKLSNLYLSAAKGVKDGTIVKQYDLASLSENSLGYYAQLWKVQYLGSGYYTLRPMHFLTSGLTGENANAEIYDIGIESTLAMVPTTERWTIEYINGGYVFKCNGNINKTLQIPNNSTSAGTSATVSYFTQATPADRWEIEGAETVENIMLLFDLNSGELVSNPRCYIAPEETRTLENIGYIASFVSEEENLYVPCAVSGTFGNISYSSSPQSITGVNPNTQGTLTFSLQRDGQLHSKSIYVNVTAIADGIYFVKNKKLGNYMQLDDDKSSNFNESDIIIEQGAFDGEDYQKWIFTHLGDGYYSILSLQSDQALSVQAEYVNTGEKSIVQQAYSGDSRQKWSITVSGSGAYIIRPQSKESYETDWCLSVSTGIGTDGRNVQQREYTNNTDYKDEWKIAHVSAFLKCHVDSTAISIQCIGTLANSESWYALITAAIESWNSSGANTEIAITSDTSSFTCEVDTYSQDWYGLTTSIGRGSVITSSTIEINARTLPTTSNSRQSTIAHEIGHILGLEDNPSVRIANDSLMSHSRNRELIFVPQVFDVNNIIFIYHDD